MQKLRNEVTRKVDSSEHSPVRLAMFPKLMQTRIDRPALQLVQVAARPRY